MKNIAIIFLLMIAFCECLPAQTSPFLEINEKWKAKKFDEAIADCDRYLQSNSNDAALVESLLFLKLSCLYGKRNLPEFEKQARAFQAKYPNSRYEPANMANMARMFKQQKRFIDLRGITQQYIDKYGNTSLPERDTMDWLLVSAWFYTNEYDKIEPFVSKTLNERPKHSERSSILFLDAEASLKNTDYAKAYEKFSKLAEADPDEGVCRRAKFYVAQAAFMLADQMGKSGENENETRKQYQRAFDLYEVFRGANIKDKSMLSVMEVREIQCLRRTKRYAELDNRVEKVLALPEQEPNKGIIFYEQGVSCYDRQQWDKALSSFDSLLAWSRIKPANKNMLKGREDIIDYDRVICIIHTANEQSAQQAVDDYASRHPNTDTAMKLSLEFVKVAAKTRNWTRCAERLNAILKSCPEDSGDMKCNIECELIKYTLLAGKTAEARQMRNRLLASNPDYPRKQELAFYDAMADFLENNYPGATKKLSEICANTPSSKQADVARIYLGISQLEEASRQTKADPSHTRDQLQLSGHKSLIEYLKSEKPPVRTDMDALYYRNDYKAIREAASSQIRTHGADSQKLAEMENWLGIATFLENPSDPKAARNHFDKALNISMQNSQLLGDEAVKATVWNFWLDLFETDLQNARTRLKSLETMPNSDLKISTLDNLQFFAR